jgi:hypothetical protein
VVLAEVMSSGAVQLSRIALTSALSVGGLLSWIPA